MQIAEAVVLALVTLTAAWSGYSAAKWSTESRIDLAAAASTTSAANRATFTAQQTRNYDASTFNAWFTAWTVGNADKMRVAERRFRPGYRAAFDAWFRTDPEHNLASPPGPAFMPQYVVPGEAQAAALDRKAQADAAAGEHAGRSGDDYVRVTVVLAGVLFLIGIGSTFTVVGTRYALLGIGLVLLVVAVIAIAGLPAPPA